MTLLNRCCCWKDLKYGCVSTGVFTMLTSLIQILVQIAVFTAALEDVGLSYFTTSADQTIYIMYLTLAALDLILAIVSGLLLCATELNTKGIRLMFPWLFVLPVYVFYEAAVNIYFFYSAFIARQNNAPTVITKSLGYLLVPIVYWTTKLVINIFGYLCILSRVQHLRRLAREEMFNKSKQAKIYYGDYSYDDAFANRYETNENAKRHNNYLYKPIKYRKIENKNATGEYVKNYQMCNGLHVSDSMDYPVLENYPMSAVPKRCPITTPCDYRMPAADYPRGLPRTPLWIHNSGIPVMSGPPMAYNSRQFSRRN